MSEWQPIESAPKDGSGILAWFAASEAGDFPGLVDHVYWDGHYPEPGWTIACECQGPGCSRAPWNYTHWMPLPNPPQQETGE